LETFWIILSEHDLQDFKEDYQIFAVNPENLLNPILIL